VALGESLRDLPFGTGLLPPTPFVVVKVPVFSFAKMSGVETILGPEMKSTGEVLGIDETFAGALRKGFIAAGLRIPQSAEGRPSGRVLVSIADSEKAGAVAILRRYADCGLTLVATDGTHRLLKDAGIPSERINKIAEGSPNVLDAIVTRSVDLVINDAAFRLGIRKERFDLEAAQVTRQRASTQIRGLPVVHVLPPDQRHNTPIKTTNSKYLTGRGKAVPTAIITERKYRALLTRKSREPHF